MFIKCTALKKTWLYIFAAVFFASCDSPKKEQENSLPYSVVMQENTQQTIKINQEMIDVNRDVVEKYISRHNWEMTETEIGLYYMIYKVTDDAPIESGDTVVFSFKTSLMNGEVLYDSESTGNRKMVIDKNLEEAGLNEGFKLLKKGEKAYFILPPHLAFGVAGDSYKIPPYSVLVYDVEVVDVMKANNASDDNDIVL